MKKIAFALVVLLLAGSAWADVTITCTVTGPNEVTVSYSEDEPNRVRAIALDLTVTGGDPDPCVIDINCVSGHYDIHPGSINIDAGGSVVDWGTCLATHDTGTCDGLDSNCVTTEQGSLYVGEGNAPPASGDLFIIQICGCGSVNVNTTENELRGGVVMEDPDEVVTVVHVGTTIHGLTNCISGCDCPGDIADSTAFGPPDGTVDIGDLNAIVIAMLTAYPTGDTTGLYDLGGDPWDPCGDIADSTAFGPPDGTVDIGDLNAMVIAMLTAYPTGDTTGLYDLGGCMTTP
jgi:hypothetical protein